MSARFRISFVAQRLLYLSARGNACFFVISMSTLSAACSVATGLPEADDGATSTSPAALIDAGARDLGLVAIVEPPTVLCVD